MDTYMLNRFNVKIKKLPQNLQAEVEDYIDFLLFKSKTAMANQEVSEWQKENVRKRLRDYKKNPETAWDFDTAMTDIEADL